MAEKDHVMKLAASIQEAAAAYDPSDRYSWMKIETEVERMRKAIQPPGMFLVKQRFHTIENVCLVTATEMGLLKLLEDHQGKTLTASDLAVMSGYDILFIARVMRVITAIGYAGETGYQSYTANAYTTSLNQAGSLGGLIICNDMIYPLASKIRQYLQEKKPCNINDTLPAYDFAMGETVWETLKKDVEWKTGFDANMTLRNQTLSVPWHLKYPIHDRISSRGTTSTETKFVILDIGGNQGVDLQRFATEFPDLNCDLILQDLQETLDGIPGPLDPRIKPTFYDFFTPQPVHGADIYYLKSVLHDWDDASSVKILSNTAKAMTSDSRLLINDIVLSDTDESLLRAEMDMLMLFLCNGMERTKTQWTELLSKVDPPLKIVNIWGHSGDQQSVIETCLA